MEIYKERVQIAEAVGHLKSDSGICSHFLQRVDHITHIQALNSIYALSPRPEWKRCIQIIKDREETRILEYQSTMGASKKVSVGLVAETKHSMSSHRYENQLVHVVIVEELIGTISVLTRKRQRL